MMNLPQSTVDEFQAQGVVILRGVFSDWVDRLREVVRQAMAAPSPLQRSYQPKDGSAPFFQDYCNWQRFADLRRFVFESQAGELAARLMQSTTARFFHDHILVKEPGSSQVTPWHTDQPYYGIEGRQSVSFWTPLDPVAREVCMECIAGSHRNGGRDFRPQRFDGSSLYQAGDFAELPAIDEHRDQFDIRGWAMEPGDAIAFNYRTIHGAPANNSTTTRRIVSSRWVGDDARWINRPGPTSPPFPHLKLDDGAVLNAPDFPVVYPR